MKRIIDLLTVFTGIWAMFSGIADSGVHEFAAYSFLALFVAHGVCYRKLLVNHVKTLGWKWAIVAAGVLLIVLSSLGGGIGENEGGEGGEYWESMPIANGTAS